VVSTNRRTIALPDRSVIAWHLSLSTTTRVVNRWLKLTAIKARRIEGIGRARVEPLFTLMLSISYWSSLMRPLGLMRLPVCSAPRTTSTTALAHFCGTLPGTNFLWRAHFIAQMVENKQQGAWSAWFVTLASAIWIVITWRLVAQQQLWICPLYQQNLKTCLCNSSLWTLNNQIKTSVLIYWVVILQLSR